MFHVCLDVLLHAHRYVTGHGWTGMVVRCIYRSRRRLGKDVTNGSDGRWSYLWN